MSTVVSPVPPSLTLPSIAPIAVPTPADRVFGCTRLCAVEFGGADPTGKVDSTAAIQKCIDSLPATGGEVHVPAGTYLVDPTVSLKFRDNMWLHLDPAAVLVLKSNDAPRYGCLAIKGVQNVLVSGGTIQGDRATHTFATQKVTKDNTHEWGHAIQMFGCSKVTVRDITLKDCTGDGISMSSSNVDGKPGDELVDDIFVKDVISTNNRRQGISVGKATNVVIQGGEISYINGTAPQDGIDIEPEAGGKTDRVFIDGVHIHHNKANGIESNHRTNVDSPITNVQVTNCLIEYNGACGMYMTGAESLEVFNNNIVNNGQTGLMIGPRSTGVHVAENTFGFNYTRGGPGKDRKDFSLFGWAKTIEADILVRNTDTNDIGRNSYI